MKNIIDSVTEQTHLIRYQYLNRQRRLFGGEVIPAAVDNLVFKQPGFPGDLVVMRGRITHVGTTSMEVQVDTYVEKAAAAGASSTGPSW